MVEVIFFPKRKVENRPLKSPFNNQNTVVSTRKHDSPLIEIAQEFASLGQVTEQQTKQDQSQVRKMRIHTICEMEKHLKLCVLVMKQTIKRTGASVRIQNI